MQQCTRELWQHSGGLLRHGAVVFAKDELLNGSSKPGVPCSQQVEVGCFDALYQHPWGWRTHARMDGWMDGWMVSEDRTRGTEEHTGGGRRAEG